MKANTYTEISRLNEPQPLFKEMPLPASFPMDALGQVGAEAARAMRRIIKAPDAICGQSILAGLAQIAQAHADISIDGRRRPISCFFVCVGDTGERKSAVDEVATWPHRNHERNIETEYRYEFVEWEKEHLAWKLARDEGLKKCKSMSAKKAHLDEMGNPPEAPPQPAVLVEEPTYEGLIRILRDGLPTVGLFTDEGGRFIGGHALNAENALKTAAGLSSLWDRGEAKRTRLGDGHSTITGKRLSMHIMLQGGVAEMLLGNDLFREQGWLSRMLVAWPESTVGQRSYVAENVFHDTAVKRYHRTCMDLLEQPLPMNDIRELNPPILDLSPDAKKLWVRFHDYCDQHARNGGLLESVRGLANKSPEHAARLAGVLSVIRGASIIPFEEMEAGIELMNYYLTEAVRIADASQQGQDVKDAAALLGWLKEKRCRLVYPALIYQYGPIRRLRDKKSALAAIELLENHGWLQSVSARTVDGKHRREVWWVIDV